MVLASTLPGPNKGLKGSPKEPTQLQLLGLDWNVLSSADDRRVVLQNLATTEPA
jgi:hypothetical protein